MADLQYYINVLKGLSCRNCGCQKKRGHAFCYRCYRLLEPDQRRALSMRLGYGFEQAFDQAADTLRGYGPCL